MRISEILAKKQTFSFEIFPPKGDMPVQEALELCSKLALNEPDFISVTYSAGGSANSDNTSAIAGVLAEDLNLNPMAHLTCLDATKADVDSYLDALKSTSPELAVGAACYLEGHIECEDFATSIEHLKIKADAGADFFVSQLFFENELFLRFREACDRARIKTPICLGIMPFTSVKQIQRMAFTCGASIPATVIKRLAAAGDDPMAQRIAGVRYACEQLRGLAAEGVDGLHVYVMNRPDVANATHDVLVDCGYLPA